MCDGLPGVVFLVVSFPTNFVKSSPYFSITNLAVKILTNCHNLLRNPLYWPIFVLRKCIPHRVKVWRGCAHSITLFPLRAKFLFVVVLFLSVAPFSVVVPDATGVELFFVTTSSGYELKTVKGCCTSFRHRLHGAVGMVSYAHAVYVICYFCYMFSLGFSSGNSDKVRIYRRVISGK